MRPLFLALVPAGVALGVLAYEVQVDKLHSHDQRAVAQVAVGLSFLLAGLIAWSRRPANRLGALMVAAGFALLLRQLRYSEDALAFTVFFLLEISASRCSRTRARLPVGPGRRPRERWLVRVGLCDGAHLPARGAPAVRPRAARSQQYGAARPGRATILVSANADAVRAAREGICDRLLRLPHHALHRAAPPAVRACDAELASDPDARSSWPDRASALRAVLRVRLRPSASDRLGHPDYLFWWQVAASSLALPIVWCSSACSALDCAAHVARPGACDLDRVPPPSLRDALARAPRRPDPRARVLVPRAQGVRRRVRQAD